MSEYLKLGFRDAKLFTKFKYIDKKTGKVVSKYDMSDKDVLRCEYKANGDIKPIKRADNCKVFIEPITSQQISNMLHCLFGERPVPMNRKVFYEQDPEFVKMANESYLKIYTPSKLSKFGDKIYPVEMIHLKKSQWNAWDKTCLLSWERIRRYLGNDETFETVITLMSCVLNRDCLKETPSNLRAEIIKNTTDDKFKLIEFLNTNNITPLYNYFVYDAAYISSFEDIEKLVADKSIYADLVSKIETITNATYGAMSLPDTRKLVIKDKTIKTELMDLLYNKDYSMLSFFFSKGDTEIADINKKKSNLTAKTVIKGPSKNMNNLNGEILVPITPEQKDRLRHSKGTATLLDGGLVSILDIIREDDIDDDSELRLVGDISLEKH